MPGKPMHSLTLLVVTLGFAACPMTAAAISQDPGQTGSKAKVRQVRPAKYVLRAASNPTADAGRGEPSLDDVNRPAAWIQIDGHDGKYGEKDGKKEPAWVIQGKVGESPSFKVEVFSSLLGKPRDFVATLYREGSGDDKTIAYSIKANKRAFAVGKKYSLLNPGKNFVIRNLSSGDVVQEIAPLRPGTYVLAAGIKNLGTSKEALAISRFTVGK